MLRKVVAPSHSHASNATARSRISSSVPFTSRDIVSTRITSPFASVAPGSVPWFAMTTVSAASPSQENSSTVVVCGGHRSLVRPAVDL